MPASAAAGMRRYHLASLEQSECGQCGQDRCGQQQTGERGRGADAESGGSRGDERVRARGVPGGGCISPGPVRLQRVGLGHVKGEVVKDPRAQFTDPVIGEERQRAHDQHRRYDRNPYQRRTQLHPAPHERDDGREGGECHRRGRGRAMARESHRDEGQEHHRRQADGWRGP